MYRRQLAAHGEEITLRRINPSPTAATDKTVRARVTGYAPEELIGGITQADRKVILLAEDVETSGFPVPIKSGSSDRVVVRGRQMMIAAVDDSTRRIGSTLIAYEIRATG
jgi:hypothetical protein